MNNGMNNIINNGGNNVVGYDPNTGAPIYANQQINNQNNMMNVNNQGMVYNNGNVKPKKKFPVWAIILIVILGIVILGFVLIVVLGIVSVSNSNKFVCESSEAKITIMYNDDELLGYSASGMYYDLDKQKELVSEVGMDAYLEAFNEWFEINAGGTCVKK